CPYNNKVPNCTKDKADNPLGVCSVYEGDKVVVTCPVRFRQEWLLVDAAAAFFFAPGTKWTSLTEIRLNDKHGKSAGNIDIVLISCQEPRKGLAKWLAQRKCLTSGPGRLRLAWQQRDGLQERSVCLPSTTLFWPRQSRCRYIRATPVLPSRRDIIP